MKGNKAGKKRSNAFCLFLLLCILIILTSGCDRVYKPERPSLEDIEQGSDGLIIEFIEGAPPPDVIEGSLIQAGIIMENKGTSDVKRGYLLLGYEKEYIKLSSWQGKGIDDRITIDIQGKSLALPEGMEDVDIVNLEIMDIGPQREKADTTIYVTVCYDYHTKGHSNVCVDTDVYNLKPREKACNAADVSLSDQGAPVAIKRIESRMIVSKEGGVVRPQFIIHFENVGDGTIIAHGRADIACSAQPLSTDDINVLKVSAVLSDLPLSCKPELLKLRKDSDYTICTLEEGIDETISSYYTPLTITADYGYMQTISKGISIRKIGI